MGKYSTLQSDIFKLFGTNSWKNENITTQPENYTANSDNEFIRVSIVASNNGVKSYGVTGKSVAGQVIIDIFTPAGGGPDRATQIADKLDSYLAGQILSSTSNGKTAFGESTLISIGNDRDNPSLYHSIYSIPFNFFGV